MKCLQCRTLSLLNLSHLRWLNVEWKSQMLFGQMKLMKAYPTLHLFLKSIGRYKKSYFPLCFSSTVDSSIFWLYLLGMLRIMSVVLVSSPLITFARSRWNRLPPLFFPPPPPPPPPPPRSPPPILALFPPPVPCGLC